jgi:hypothetical protein
MVENTEDPDDLTATEKKELKEDKNHFEKNAIKDLFVCETNSKDIDEVVEIMKMEFEKALEQCTDLLIKKLTSKKK